MVRCRSVIPLSGPLFAYPPLPGTTDATPEVVYRFIQNQILMCTTPHLSDANSQWPRGWRLATVLRLAPLRTVVHNLALGGRCFNCMECLEVVVGGKVLEEVTLLLHDAVELVNVDLTIAITVGLVDHVLELLIVDVLTELLSHAGEVAEGDLVGVVVIEELEHLLDVLAGVLLAHLAGHHLEELADLDGAVTVVVDVGDHLLELLVLDLEAKGTHGGLELTDVDLAGGIRVEEGERLADLVELLVGELTWLLLGGTAG